MVSPKMLEKELDYEKVLHENVQYLFLDDINNAWQIINVRVVLCVSRRLKGGKGSMNLLDFDLCSRENNHVIAENDHYFGNFFYIAKIGNLYENSSEK